MKEIMTLYYEINRIYLELYKLELNMERDSTSFYELVSLLKEKIVEERRLIDENKDKYDYGKINIDKMDNIYVKRLVDYFNFSCDVDRNMTDDDYYSKIYKGSSQNLFLIYLSFLEEMLDRDSYSMLRDKLLNYKYYNAFMFHDVEGVLLNNNFKVDRFNYVDIDLMIGLYKNRISNVDSIVLDCYYDTLITIIGQLMSIKDFEYGNFDRLVVSLNNQCMLKAAIALIGDSDFLSVSKYVYSYISSLVSEDNKISFDIISTVLNERDKCKERVRRISIGF